MKKPPVSANHWNNHQMCAIDVETSGLDPYHDQIVQLAIVPLTANFEQRKDVVPFNIYIKPDMPEHVSAEAMRKNRINLDVLMRYGHDIEKAKDLLDNWVDKLELAYTAFGSRKRILPLAHNWPFDSAFIKRWLGPDHYSEIFDARYRDTQMVAEYLNDRAAMHCEKVPFSKVNLAWVCKQLGVENLKAHNALYDCLATAECYRLMTMSRGAAGVA